jgi:hypothetical protein
LRIYDGLRTFGRTALRPVRSLEVACVFVGVGVWRELRDEPGALPLVHNAALVGCDVDVILLVRDVHYIDLRQIIFDQ